MTSAFDNLSGPGKPLRPEPPDAAEFAGLRRSASARLGDATNYPAAIFTAVPLTDTIIIPFASPSTS